MYKYLTRSYVEWLGLERIPITKRRRGAMICHGNDRTLPRPDSSGWCEGVRYKGELYERERDGLAYVRMS